MSMYTNPSYPNKVNTTPFHHKYYNKDTVVKKIRNGKSQDSSNNLKTASNDYNKKTEASRKLFVNHGFVIENKIWVADFEANKSKLQELYADVTAGTLEFILESHANIGKDPRVNSAHQKAGKKIDIKSVKEGDILEGVVRNVVAFWAFVDIGMKNDGLVHISQLVDRFISDPKEVVEVGQKVKVKLLSIDEKTGKIQLSMKDAQ